ncbi:MAG: hypothetical protein LBG20_02810 [Holosporaceae bacterium]|nr:hypothetical protein [Holosporaceae bacterium]
MKKLIYGIMISLFVLNGFGMDRRQASALPGAAVDPTYKVVNFAETVPDQLRRCYLIVCTTVFNNIPFTEDYVRSIAGSLDSLGCSYHHIFVIDRSPVQTDADVAGECKVLGDALYRCNMIQYSTVLVNAVPMGVSESRQRYLREGIPWHFMCNKECRRACKNMLCFCLFLDSDDIVHQMLCPTLVFAALQMKVGVVRGEYLTTMFGRGDLDRLRLLNEPYIIQENVSIATPFSKVAEVAAEWDQDGRRKVEQLGRTAGYVPILVRVDIETLSKMRDNDLKDMSFAPWGQQEVVLLPQQGRYHIPLYYYRQHQSSILHKIPLNIGEMTEELQDFLKNLRDVSWIGQQVNWLADCNPDDVMRLSDALRQRTTNQDELEIIDRLNADSGAIRERNECRFLQYFERTKERALKEWVPGRIW